MADPMQSFANCLRKIEHVYGRDGFHGDVPVQPEIYAIFDDGGRLRPQQLVIAGKIWNMGPPGVVLDVIADMVDDHPQLMTPFRAPGWMGIAFAMEGWMVEEDDPGKFEALANLAEERLIHTHPKRRTVRVVYGITREQERVMVMHMEHGPGVEVDADRNWPGAVQDGLVKLVATVDGLLS